MLLGQVIGPAAFVGVWRDGATAWAVGARESITTAPDWGKQQPNPTKTKATAGSRWLLQE